MGPISSWLQADTSVKTTWGQAEAAAVESKKEAVEAKEASDGALANAASTKERRAEEETKLKALQEEQASRNQMFHQREEDMKAHEANHADRDTELA